MKSFAEACDMRKNNFDVLRLLFAVAVIASHSKIDEAAHAMADTTDMAVRFLGFGRMSVNGFFTISGFLITMSWVRGKGLGDYLKKRLLRIYPGLIVSMLIAALVVVPISTGSLSLFAAPGSWQYFNPLWLQENYRFPGDFPWMTISGEFIGPIWTIRYELAAYFLVAGLGLCGLIKNPLAILLLFVAVLVAFHFQYQAENGWPLSVPYFGRIRHIFRFTAFFLAGAVFYLYWKRIPYSWPLFFVSVIGYIIGCNVFSAILVPICGSYALFFLAFTPIGRLGDFKEIVKGDYSYGVYLYAWPVQQLLIQFYRDMFDDGMKGRILMFVADTSLTLILAIASWHLVEKNFLKFKSKPAPELAPAAPSG